VLLSGVAHLREIYRRRSLPSAMVRQFMANIGEMMLLKLKDHHKIFGVWACRRVSRGLPWCCAGILSARPFGLRVSTFWSPLFHVFRHKCDGTVLALSAGEVKYLADGQLYSDKRFGTNLETWISRFESTKTHYIGFPLHPGTAAYCAKRSLSQSPHGGGCWP